MSFKKRQGLCSALLSLALLIPVASNAQASDNVMRIAVPFGPKSEVPDPRARQNGWLSNRAGVSETLIGLDSKMQQIPRLASEYVNVAPKKWKISLRKGVLFHDTSEMKADDVKASFDLLKDKSSTGYNPRLSALLDIESIDVIDDYSLMFNTTKPNAAFLWSLTEPSAAVLKAATKTLPIVATGPFVFISASINKNYITRRFDNYWGGKPKLKGMQLDAIADPSVAVLALQSNDVDLVTNYSEPDFARLVKENSGQRFNHTTTRLFFYQLRTAQGSLQKKALRQAISLSINRQLLVDVALAGVGGTVANSIFAHNMKSWVNERAQLPYDIEKAKKILDLQGIVDSDGNGFRELAGTDINLKLRSYEGRPALRPTLEITQAMLAELGIKAEISIGEFEANSLALRNTEIHMHLQAWGTAPQGDPDYFPSTLLRSNANANHSGYSNAKLDILLDKGRAEFADTKRKVYYDEIQQIINQDLPIIPLFHKNQLSVGNGKVKGYQIHPAETYMATVKLDLDDK
jgi:peptide/nickel transport system substrate-binding protein